MMSKVVFAGAVLWAVVVMAQTPTETPTVAPTPIVTMTSITIAPEHLSLKEGDIIQLTATGHFSNGTELPNLPVVWVSSNAQVATVSNVAGLSVQPQYMKQVVTVPKSGELVGMGDGTTTITAKYAMLHVETDVTVEGLPTPTATVTPSPEMMPTPVPTNLPTHMALKTPHPASTAKK